MFFFKQKTAYEMRISDWSSDVCSSDLQVAALKLDGVAADSINSSRDRQTNVATWRRVAAGELRLLYISPERLMTERMVAALQRLPLALIAVDEAHCISRWGPSFRPAYQALARVPAPFPDRKGVV